MSPIERHYKITHAAWLLDQNPRTIKRRIAEGLIKKITLADGSDRIAESELLRYAGIDPSTVSCDNVIDPRDEPTPGGHGTGGISSHAATILRHQHRDAR